MKVDSLQGVRQDESFEFGQIMALDEKSEDHQFVENVSMPTC